MDAREVLSQWADPDTGGTMPPEVRKAALEVLEDLDALYSEDACPKCGHAASNVCFGCLLEEQRERAEKAAARVKELEADVIYEQERNRLNVLQYSDQVERLRLDLAEACRCAAVLARERNEAVAEVERLTPQYQEVQELRAEIERLREAMDRAVRSEYNRREDGEPFEFGQGRLAACRNISIAFRAALRAPEGGK